MKRSMKIFSVILMMAMTSKAFADNNNKGNGDTGSALKNRSNESPVGCLNLQVFIPHKAGPVMAADETQDATVPLSAQICTVEKNVVEVPQSSFDDQATGDFQITVTDIKSGKQLAQYSFKNKFVVTAAGRADTIYAASVKDASDSLDPEKQDMANAINFTIRHDNFSSGDSVGYVSIHSAGQTFGLTEQ